MQRKFLAWLFILTTPAIQESHEGSVAEWLEKVSEDDYKLPDITAKKLFSSLF